jgi:hypothetical protein
MPTRFWIILVLSVLAGIAVLMAKPTGQPLRLMGHLRKPPRFADGQPRPSALWSGS